MTMDDGRKRRRIAMYSGKCETKLSRLESIGDGMKARRYLLLKTI